MSSELTWQLILRKSAQRAIARAAKPERDRLVTALESIRREPFAGDVARLKGQRIFRRRVGDWRVFFDAYPHQRRLEVIDVVRRTTTTYRKRH